MNEKITIVFNDKAKEILKNIYPEMRNAAVNIAVTMLAKDPMFSKYFCINCEEESEEEAATLDSVDEINKKPTPSSNNNNAPEVMAWDNF